MVEFAEKVERTLLANDSLPKRVSDRSLIGDLADLEWRTAILWQAVQEFVATGQLRSKKRSFEARLMLLVSAIDSVHAVCGDLKGPISRLLRARCGFEGLALASLSGANATLWGLRKP